jgi:hypothetical protein
MIITPRKSATRNPLGVFGSLVAILGGACAFLIMLQDYMHTSMSHPVPHMDAAALSYDQPLFISAAERACFQAAPPAISSDMKRVVLSQVVAIRAGDIQTAQRYVNVPPQGLCELHLNAVLRTCSRVANAKVMQIEKTTISPDLDKGFVYCRVAEPQRQPAVVVYCLVLDQLGRWKVQNIEVLRRDSPYALPEFTEQHSDWRHALS